MLHIIFLVLLCRSVSRMMKEKKHRPAGYVILTVLLWIVCEAGGALIGWLSGEHVEARAAVGAVLGASVGALLSMVIATSVSDKRFEPLSAVGKRVAAELKNRPKVGPTLVHSDLNTTSFDARRSRNSQIDGEGGGKIHAQNDVASGLTIEEIQARQLHLKRDEEDEVITEATSFRRH